MESFVRASQNVFYKTRGVGYDGAWGVCSRHSGIRLVRSLTGALRGLASSKQRRRSPTGSWHSLELRQGALHGSHARHSHGVTSGALRAVAAFTMLGGALRGMARHSP